jgi:DNA-binding LacI/PurR family transcriptional regulator
LHDAGRVVPDDVSVVGFDDTQESEFFSPPLTTVRQDLDEVGRRSVDLLLGAIGGEEPQHVTIEPTLVVRVSTARAPR